MTEDLKLQLFELKQKFLREIPHPKLILKEIKILKRINPEIDFSELRYDQVEMNATEKSGTLESFLENQVQKELQDKQSISQALDTETLFQSLFTLFQHQVVFLKKLQSYLPVIAEGVDKEVKMSSPFNAYHLLKRIHELNLKENEIKDYLCRVIKAQEKPLDIIAINCLRANKILSHV